MEIDKSTGEVLSPEVKAIQPWYKRTYDTSGAIPIKNIVGERPEYLNLKDHPELDGRSILILRYETSSGEFGPFYKIASLLLNPDGTVEKPVVIMTGASDVVERIEVIAPLLDVGQQIKGTLHNVGRAWLLE